MERFARRALTCVALGALELAFANTALAQLRTQNVVLVTLDGARHQEVFGGLDLDILRSTAAPRPVESLQAYREFWDPSPAERRRRLLPFFWGTLMARGSIAGNPALGSRVRLTNGHRFSYPGYSEMFTGQAFDDVIRSNDVGQNPFETVFEFVRRKLTLRRTQVASFASWEPLRGIVERTRGAITSNAGLQRYESRDRRFAEINALQIKIRPPWPQIRHDRFTFEMAMDFLRREKPRLLHLGLDETDDWAHDGNYELVLDSYARSDRQLRQLFAFLDTDPQYEGRTTVIVTTDHGRGRTLADWRSHGRDIDGSEETWLAVIGPDSPQRGEWRNVPLVYQNQVAATIGQLFGLDFAELRPTAGRPLPVVAPTR